MAKRPSIQEILAAARKAGAAAPVEEAVAGTAPAPEEEAAEPAVEPAPAGAAMAEAAPAAEVPTPQKLGRPLTLQEKLAAARAKGGPPAPAPAPAAVKTARPTPPVTPIAAESEAPVAEAAPAPAPAPPRTVPPSPAPVGRPLTLQEKLAAARGAAAASAPAPAGTAKAVAPPKPAAATGKAAPAPAPKRELPPLDKITDPKDLAEALRQAAVKRGKEAEAAKAKDAPAAKPGREKESRPSTVLPRPSKAAALASAMIPRRSWFSITAMIWIGWGAFALGVTQFTALMGRFMFPNVLAEPPSTIKIGLPANYEPEDVNERFKAEWGFWVVRSTRYGGEDIIYALKSVCTHLGCPPNWLAGEQKFKCPCHGSGFYISGINFEGPAPRPLERFKLVVGDDGQLVVDKSQLFQQELGQWSDPESYIQV
jgi:cytochrome b6-f complex iron-sulfur subunit